MDRVSIDRHLGMDKGTDTAQDKAVDKGSNNSLADSHIKTDLAVKKEVVKEHRHQFRHETDVRVSGYVRDLDQTQVLRAHDLVQEIDKAHSHLVYS